MAVLPAVEKPIQLAPADLVWRDAPIAMPPGAQVAVLEGNPQRAGLFTMRAKFPPGYKLARHIHEAPERVTVLSGSVRVSFDATTEGRLFEAGSFYVTPPGVPHAVSTETGAELQLTTMGPWLLQYKP